MKMPTGKISVPEKGPKDFKPTRDHLQPHISIEDSTDKFKHKGYGGGHDMRKLGAHKSYKV